MAFRWSSLEATWETLGLPDWLCGKCLSTVKNVARNLTVTRHAAKKSNLYAGFALVATSKLLRETPQHQHPC